MLKPTLTFAQIAQAVFDTAILAAYTGGNPFVGISAEHPPIIGIHYPGTHP